MSQKPRYKFYPGVENNPEVIQEVIENIAGLWDKRSILQYDLIAITPSQDLKTVMLVWKSKDQ